MADGKTFDCAIITPEAKVFEGKVQFAALPAHDGEIGVLYDRAPLLCKLGIGVLRIREHAGPRKWFVDGGFAQVIENRLTVLTQKAMAPEAIDRGAAQQALDEAQRIEIRDDKTRQAHNDAVARARAQIKLVSGS
jgi:F-type H+-transporting ATPase subunit epsilon